MDGAGIAAARQEGALDVDWYVRTYPQVSQDLNRRLASDPSDHYARFGRFRA